MIYFSGFTSHHGNLKRIYRNSRETKHCRVGNDTKKINSRFLFPVSMGLILVFTQLFKSKLLLRSLKLR